MSPENRGFFLSPELEAEYSNLPELNYLIAQALADENNILAAAGLPPLSDVDITDPGKPTFQLSKKSEFYAHLFGSLLQTASRPLGRPQ